LSEQRSRRGRRRAVRSSSWRAQCDPLRRGYRRLIARGSGLFNAQFGKCRRNCVNFTTFAAAGRATVNKLPKIPRPRRAPRGTVDLRTRVVERSDEYVSKSARSTQPPSQTSDSDNNALETSTAFRNFVWAFRDGHTTHRVLLAVTSSRHQPGNSIVSRKRLAAIACHRATTDFDNTRRLRFTQQITHR
jgi:hypothetical protein